MADGAILAIDQGTTNSKAVLVSETGQILAKGSAPVGINYPNPGWVEQDADDLWTSSLAAIANCLAQQPDTAILAIGISNQRESVAAWNRSSGEPLAPVVTWQCRRTTNATLALKANGHERRVIEATGLPLDPLFPALKMRWLIDHVDPSLSSDLCLGTVDSWLIFRLTGGENFATDRSNASRTQLLNIATGDWDDDLCRLFDVPKALLPSLRDSSTVFGKTSGVPGLPDGIPIAAAIGDSHAALFGHSAFRPGDAKVTFGTGSSTMVNVPGFRVPEQGITTTIAWSIDGKITYALEGNILASASIFPWTAEMLGLGKDAVGHLLDLAKSVESSEGVYLVPAHVGLGAPYWRPEATGLITGLRFSTTPAHVARAAAESMALQVVNVLDNMACQIPMDIGSISVDGSPTGNSFLMQLVSDLLGRTIRIGNNSEVSALGAGALAGLAIGLWESQEEISRLWRESRIVKPGLTEADRQSLIAGWTQAVARCALLPDAKPKTSRPYRERQEDDCVTT